MSYKKSQIACIKRKPGFLVRSNSPAECLIPPLGCPGNALLFHLLQRPDLLRLPNPQLYWAELVPAQPGLWTGSWPSCTNTTLRWGTPDTEATPVKKRIATELSQLFVISVPSYIGLQTPTFSLIPFVLSVSHSLLVVLPPAHLNEDYSVFLLA